MLTDRILQTLISMLFLTACAYAGYTTAGIHARAEPKAAIVRKASNPDGAISKGLRDYGERREQQDRESFPIQMPKAGEPYDPVTGNAIRR